MGSIFALEYPLTLQKNKTDVKNKKKSKKNKKLKVLQYITF